jgi:phytoene synthase
MNNRQSGRAAALGKAMQLTNIIRDIGEDLRRGRIYLPQDELKTYGVTESLLQNGRVTPGFVRLMQFNIQRARSYYESSNAGIDLLPNDGSRLCVTLMSRTYARILDVVEQIRYDTLKKRACVSFMQKMVIAGSSLAGASWKSDTEHARRNAITAKKENIHAI